MANRRFDGDPIEGSLNKARKPGRNARDIVREVNDDNHLENPTSGATLKKGLDDTDTCDTIRGHEHKQNQTVFEDVQ
jgi:hypothetical protein